MQILNLQMLSWTMVKYWIAPELDRQKVLFKVISPYLLSIFIPRDKIKQVVSKSRSAVCSRVYNLSKQECQGWTQRQSSSHKSIIHIAGKRWAKYQGAIKQVWTNLMVWCPQTAVQGKQVVQSWQLLDKVQVGKTQAQSCSKGYNRAGSREKSDNQMLTSALTSLLLVVHSCKKPEAVLTHTGEKDWTTLILSYKRMWHDFHSKSKIRIKPTDILSSVFPGYFTVFPSPF